MIFDLTDSKSGAHFTVALTELAMYRKIEDGCHPKQNFSFLSKRNL